VERKSVEDFLESLLDGRLFQQARQLVAYPRPILIIEGTGLTTSRNIPRGSIYGALASLTTDFGISVITVEDPQETIQLLAAIAKREQTEPRRDISLRPNKVTLNDVEQRRFILEGLPHVSGVLARRLLDHFGSVERVMSATKEELMQVDGVGRKTAEDIRKVLGGMT
jgi:ERCC4-type nuclease